MQQSHASHATILRLAALTIGCINETERCIGSTQPEIVGIGGTRAKSLFVFRNVYNTAS